MVDVSLDVYVGSYIVEVSSIEVLVRSTGKSNDSSLDMIPSLVDGIAIIGESEAHSKASNAKLSETREGKPRCCSW
jgi:hypothetical protein